MAQTPKNNREADLVRSILDPNSMELGPVVPSKAGLKKLLEVLKGDKEERSGFALGNAMRYVAEGDPSPETAELIASYLSDADLDPGLRRQAAAALGRLPGEVADNALAAALGSAEAVGEAAILSALALAGGKAGLAAIRNLPEPATLHLARLRAYAETAIAYRIGETPAAETEAVVLPTASSYPIVRESAKSLSRVIEAVEGRPFGLALNSDVGFSYQCGATRHAVLLNGTIERGKFLEAVRGERKIAGIVVMEDRARGRFTLRNVIFLRPEKDYARLSVVRPTGEVVMAGELRPGGDGLDLTLRDLTVERWPISVRGRVTDSDVELKAEVFIAPSRPKQSGEPIVIRRA